MSEDEPLHECADCGFLTARLVDDFTFFAELDEDFRESGLHRNALFGDPLCFMRRRLIGPEYDGHVVEYQANNDDEIRADYWYQELWIDLLHLPIPCSDFTPWKQGFTPKEHWEMLDRQWRLEFERKGLEDAAKREDARDAAMNKREDARDLTAETWHNQNLKVLQGQHRIDLLVFGGLIAAATVASGIVGGLISRGVDVWPF